MDKWTDDWKMDQMMDGGEINGLMNECTVRTDRQTDGRTYG